MQFITNGPDIPDALLQAHEEGRVVFFCGAGISYPAGLPGFQGLVEKLYALIGTSPNEIEQEAFRKKQFDATLDLLEHRIPGRRLAVRSKLAEVLKPKLRRKGAIDTHTALLRLARNREGMLRLVTTNFDRVFHVAAKRINQSLQTYAAPMLPIPKNSRWDGLVCLHGLLPEKTDETALNRLVMTSGDFGLAYLTERWAARFVSELFRNYVVCFVGYSINDPVLRYMMDALAADRMLGEITPQAWALGDYEPGYEHSKTVEWEAKGVTPILYEIPAGSFDHSALHKTLQVWADTYRDGFQGKERIVDNHALARPSASTQQDDFVGRMLWALSDESGLPAKRFANLNPVPSLDWLEVFSEARFQHSDLARFQVPAHNEIDKKLRFSLINRPASYDKAPRMLLVHSGANTSQWDDRMSHLARWLVRHLGDPKLVIWIAQHGGELNDQFAWLIEQELSSFTSLERSGDTIKLNEIRSQAPNAIPSPLMRKLWRLLLSGRVKSPWCHADIHSWKKRLKRDGLNSTLRLELRDLLAPQLLLKEPFRWRDEVDSDSELTHIKQLVEWELVLTASNVHSGLSKFSDDSWVSALPLLIEDFQSLLRDALDLLCDLDDTDNYSDFSYWHLPSITPHRQNRGFHDWVSLIELLRDSWLALRNTDVARATQIAQSWFKLPYLSFKRLALFSASQEGCIAPEQWVDWLLADDSRWLWHIGTKREMFRLLVLQGHHLKGATQALLESAILAGPPRAMYRDDLEPDQWLNLESHTVWLRLSKLNSVEGLILGAEAQTRLMELSNANPQWRLANNESDEFSSWMSGTGDPDYIDNRVLDIAPRKREELVQWLRKPKPEERFGNAADTWRDVCRTRFFHSFLAFRDLMLEDEWPAERWRQALQVWSEKSFTSRSWRYVAPLLKSMPDEVFLSIIHGVSYWIESTSESIVCNETILLELCKRVLALPFDADTSARQFRNGVEIYNPVSSAINHPVGHITQALIYLCFKQNPNDNDLLPDQIKSLFMDLCDVNVERFRHGRVLLSSHLISLFRVDRQWTEQYLLPFFSWSNPTEAQAVWEGFLWSPRLYQPLLFAFKQQFMETARHYEELGEHRQQFAMFLTHAALVTVEEYTVEDFRLMFASLPQHGLDASAQALFQALEGAADQREDYWKNRIEPFWQKVWPKVLGSQTPQIAESLARLIIAAGGEFPAALVAIQSWLQPIEHPDYVVYLLHESGLSNRYPDAALQLLDAVIANQPWAGQEVGKCLDAIKQANPQLEQDPRYQRLREYSLTH